MLNKTFNPFPVLQTEKLTLRKLVIADAQAIFTLRSDLEINKYLDRRLSENIGDASNFISSINGNIDKNECVYWAITLNEDNAFVGTICLFSFSDENASCEIGYELLPAFQGRGLMKEAAAAVIAFAFDLVNVQKIAAFLHRDNQPSIKLLEKLSFRNSNQPDQENPNLIGYYLTASPVVV